MKNLLTVICVGLLAFSPLSAKKVAKAPGVGDSAPTFKTLDDEGNEWNSKDLLGKKHLVVYFYPAAMTGGCTKQACAYRDDKKKWTELDAIVVAVSGDTPEGLGHFKTAENLNFTLLSDEKGRIAKSFGVPMRPGGSLEREVNGKKVTLTRGVTTARWTFVISKEGKIVHKNNKVNAAKDSEAVRAILAKLKG